MQSPSTAMDIQKKHTGKILSKPGFYVVFYTSIEQIGDAWDSFFKNHNVFLQKHYWQGLENHPPKGMRFGYLAFYKDDQLAGLSGLQAVSFKADQSINDDRSATDACFFRAFGKLLKSLVASRVSFNALVCGNLLVTGEHGFSFNPQIVDPTDSIALLEEGLDFARKGFEKEGFPIDVTFIKDFFEEKRSNASILTRDGYYEFCVQPNMIMEIPEHWKSIDDYLGDMISKYRVRAKRAFKKAEGIVKRSFNADQIDRFRDELHHLYLNVAENASFNIAEITPGYFLHLKEEFGDDFNLTAYFHEGNLVGFYTTFINYDELETHFLGYDKILNKEHQLYLNMLYDMVRDGIRHKVKRIQFARTALEIKSSIGAKPHDMFCYIRHRNSFANKFTKHLLEYLNPADDWIPRNPFKN